MFCERRRVEGRTKGSQISARMRFETTKEGRELRKVKDSRIGTNQSSSIVLLYTERKGEQVRKSASWKRKERQEDARVERTRPQAIISTPFFSFLHFP